MSLYNYSHSSKRGVDFFKRTKPKTMGFVQSWQDHLYQRILLEVDTHIRYIKKNLLLQENVKWDN